jgi:D-amino peptidase
MKVYISCDMEGISGVVAGKQTQMDGEEYKRAQKLMTNEVNAAIEGALAGGASEVLVNDSHGSMRNILIEELNPSAQLISGSPKPLSMMQGIDGGFDAAFFIGYHAQAGTAYSVLDHTYSGATVYQVSLNGQPVGETGLNAALAGHFGVPVVLVTGDKLLVEEAKTLLGTVEGVAVKESYGRYAAKCLVPKEACELIREAAQRALSKGGTPFVVESPTTLTVDFNSSAHLDMAELIPGANRVSGRRIEFIHDDLLTIYKVWRAMLKLAR